MHNLIYISSASYLFTKADLVDILNKSRVNNAFNAITGMLLYHEGSILQILEGEESTLKTVFAKISQDHRHKNVIKMIDSSISERNFGGWLMGFKKLSDADWSNVTGYFDLDKNAVNELTGVGQSKAINLIKSFAYVSNLK